MESRFAPCLWHSLHIFTRILKWRSFLIQCCFRHEDEHERWTVYSSAALSQQKSTRIEGLTHSHYSKSVIQSRIGKRASMPHWHKRVHNHKLVANKSPNKPQKPCSALLSCVYVGVGAALRITSEQSWVVSLGKSENSPKPCLHMWRNSSNCDR